MKKLLAALTVALLATVSIRAHAKDWTTIRFGVDASYPPFESEGFDGKLVGFDIDLGNEICARLKAKCVSGRKRLRRHDPGPESEEVRRRALVDVHDAATRRTGRVLEQAVQHADAPRREEGQSASCRRPKASLKGKNGRRGTGHDSGNLRKDLLGAEGHDGHAVPERTRSTPTLMSGRLDATLQDAVQAKSAS